MSDPSTAINAAPWVADAAPYINAIVGPLVLAVLGFAFAEIKKMTGFALSASLQSQIDNWAATEAGAMVAKAENNLAGKSFTVASPEVAAIVNAMPAEVAAAMDALGVTPAGATKIVVGEIGKLQSNQTVLPAPSKP